MPLYKQNISTPIIKVRGYALGPLGLSNSESKTAIISWIGSLNKYSAILKSNNDDSEHFFL